MERKILYPIGVQNFESLRRDGYAYVDKTALVWELANTGRYYFLSRPRRFGKSLLVSTLEAYFQGKRELFDGLALAGLEHQWKSYPVLHLDLNAKRYSCPEDLTAILNMHLEQWEKRYGDEYKDRNVDERFAQIIRRACEQTGDRVVVLVDEYDKPLVQTLDNEELADEYRSMLKGFYGVLKSSDQYIRFALLTGVTKLSKVSVFSDLNNLDDISMWNRFHSLCGLTEDEIRSDFDSDVERLATANDMGKEECYEELRRMYDGYHFCENSVGVYNPFSVINTLKKLKFGDYWFETGTPTLLVSVLKSTHYDLNGLLESEVSSDLLGSVDSMRVNPLPVIYQTGYLTIKSFDREFNTYRLGFPNEEVERGFVRFLLPFYSNARLESTLFSVSRFVGEVRKGQPDAFMTRLSSMMADTDYRIVGDSELYFQNFLFLFFRLLGLYVEVEHTTSDGRTDMVVRTSDYIYLFEFKLDRSADEALAQIEDRGYARPYAADPRRLFKIGVNFSTRKRCVEEWKVV